MKKQKAFTIVELLIVIVVIGILAAISIVAFNGIRARANLSETAHFASSAVRVLRAYKAAEGTYPGTTGCIGSGYIDRTGDGVADCRWNSGGNVWAVSPTLNAQLEKYAQVGKTPTYFALDGGTIGLQGATYYRNTAATLDGVTQSDWVVYAVEGDVCPFGPIYERISWPHLVTNPSVTKSYGFSGGGSECWIPLR
jgi:prepilin-type N-terminal cleavage/methylation domain-containing protein